MCPGGTVSREAMPSPLLVSRPRAARSAQSLAPPRALPFLFRPRALPVAHKAGRGSALSARKRPFHRFPCCPPRLFGAARRQAAGLAPAFAAPLVCPPRAALAGAAGDGGRGRFCPFHRARGVPCAGGRGVAKARRRRAGWAVAEGGRGRRYGFGARKDTFRTPKPYVSGGKRTRFAAGRRGLRPSGGARGGCGGGGMDCRAAPPGRAAGEGFEGAKGAMRAKSGLVAFKWINLYDEMGVFLDTK